MAEHRTSKERKRKITYRKFLISEKKNLQQGEPINSEKIKSSNLLVLVEETCQKPYQNEKLNTSKGLIRNGVCILSYTRGNMNILRKARVTEYKG